MHRWPTNGVAKIMALALAINLLIFACGGDKEAIPVKLVPQGSNLIGEVNLAGIIGNDSLTAAVASLPTGEGSPQSLDDLLDKAVGTTGIDFRLVSQLVVFADILRQDEFGGVIAKGRFEEAAIVKAIERREGKATGTSEYRGRVVYSFGDPLDDQTLAFIEDSNLVLGTQAAVRAVIDVQDGERQRVSGTVRDAFNNLGKGLFSLAVAVPSEGLPNQLSEQRGIPFLPDTLLGLPGVFGALQYLELVGLSVAQNGQILILRANLDFENSASASTVGDFLEGILKLVSGLSGDADTSELLESVELVTDGGRMTIRLEMSQSDLGGLVSSIFSISNISSDQPQAPEVVTEPPVLLGLGLEIAIMPTEDHLPEGQTVEYSTVPPTSGDPLRIWADCGFYEDGLPDELITHNLEHGNIVVSYNLADQQQVDQLRTIMDNIDISADWGVTRYYDKIPEGTVALAAWGRLDTIKGIDRERIATFFGAYSGQLGPELIAC